MALTIGKLAKTCGLQPDTLRYYEKLGLIQTEGRKANGYRVFNIDMLKRLQFIKRAKLLNFTLEEIKDLLVVKGSSKAKCEDIYQRLQKKIAEVESKIRELDSFKRQLKTISKNCPRGIRPVKDCSLMDFLERPTPCHQGKKQQPTKKIQLSTRAIPVIFAAILVSSPGWAASNMQDHDMMGMSDMDMPNMGIKQGNSSSSNSPSAQPMNMAGDKNMDMSQPMLGALGPYKMGREASGTSWQPDSTPMQGMRFMTDSWDMMAQAEVNGIYDNQGGQRGANKTFSSSMAMLMGQHAIGDRGTLGLRSMISLDPLMGPNGYPLLFATGETANGSTPLVDRQHPHDLFMELAGTYSYRLTDNSSAFLYAGLPGEPALGPITFMHRFSGMDNPEAPITHHWLDSTHITYGVVTAGYVYDNWKIEGSTFRGREPDQHRYNIESPKLDSYSTRLTYNPTADWSLQTSWGYMKSPEQLKPNVNENRVTASGTYNLPFDKNNWATTFAWGRKIDNPGHNLDGFLLESSVVLNDTHTFFSRAERVGEDELFDGTPTLDNQVLTVNQFTLGYIRDFHPVEHLKFGVGGLISRYAYPDKINSYYGGDPTSFMLFVRLKLI